ncbi:hypothetical protein R3W88_024357 [Solanum pinnatisectum]|uniref:Uncharacterized protein n=1 Tax=Solanum pinnatisectum TaxID=50273 RepID=A0AAV9M288_9SOLN|nr:hypothetical protein R3W88_024357 [Solanum pinnatisectum]
MSLLSDQLEPKVFERGEVECETNLRANYDKEFAVVTRSGKIAVGNARGNNVMITHEEEKDVEEEERPIQAHESYMLKEKEESLKTSLTKELQKVKEKATSTPKIVQPLPKITPSFPQRLKKKNEDEKFKKFLSLVTKKRSMDFETIKVSHNCSAIMTSEMITEKEDPRAFTIPCTIGMLQFAKAFINLMPYAIYNQLGLGVPKSTTMRLLMADQSIKHPVGIHYDILVKVDRFIFLVDFVILDYEIDAEIPIILGIPFLATRRALVDIESGVLMFRVNDDEVTFNVCKSMKHPSDIHMVSIVDVIDEVVASNDLSWDIFVNNLVYLIPHRRRIITIDRQKMKILRAKGEDLSEDIDQRKIERLEKAIVNLEDLQKIDQDEIFLK